MTFLTTPYLWLGLAAAALPVIIHLIRRAKVQVVPFAAMRFLQATPQRMIRRQRLKQILLLLLRILALLLLGFAFARPFLQGSTPAALIAKQQKAIAIVIDASASMLAGTKSEQAKAAAEGIIRRAGRGDRFSIVTVGATPQILLEDGDAPQARAALNSLHAAPTAGDLREAVLAADNLLRQQAALKSRQSELHVVSDLQLSNSPESVVTLGGDAQSFVSEAFPAWQNVAVMEGTIDDVPACRVRNFANVEQTAEVILQSARSNPAVAGRQRVTLRAAEERVVQFPEARGKIASGYFEVRVAVDDFAQDNQFYCSFQANAARRVLAIADQNSSLFFVRQAFEVAGPASFRLGELHPNKLPNAPLRDYECVILAAGSGLDRSGGTLLKTFVQDGGGLLIAPPSHGGQRGNDAATYNLLLADLMPAKLLPPVFGSVDRNRNSRLVDVDFAHPVFKIFSDAANGDPASARFFQYFTTAPVARSGAATLAAFDDGHAALMETTFGKGKVLLWTAGLDAQWSDLPLKPIFLPLIHQMIGYLARPQVKTESLVIGQPILPHDFDPRQTVEVILPDGSQQEMAVGAVSFNETWQAGIYRLRQRGKEVCVAVNLDRRESDPQALSPADFLARLSRSHEETQVAGVFGSTETSELDRERSQKLWRLALLALLVILVAEGWLAKRTLR